MIKLLIFGAIIYIGYTLAKMWLRSVLPSPPKAEGPASRQGESMVEDLQCGTFIPTADAISKTIAGKKYYFCSRECRDAYLKNK